MNKEYFVLFRSSQIVRGVIRSVICDLERHDIHFIPNDLYDILNDYSKESIFEIKQKFNNKYDEILDEYFDFLLINQLGFLCSSDELEMFPQISLEFELPYLITNCIIDFNKNLNYKEVINDLETLGCKNLQFRVFNVDYSLNDFNEIFERIEKTRIINIELILPFQNIADNILLNYININKRITKIFFFNSPEHFKSEISELTQYVDYSTKKIENETHCGVINLNTFSVNISTFTENQNYNGCLNKKISVDVNGDIKNCPSMMKNYGNIQNVSLKSVIQNSEFIKYWSINKKQIDVCKDCEFRFVCSDCRAYIDDEKNLFSRPLKCNYNPYIAKWGNEEGYIKVSEMTKAQIDEILLEFN